MEIGFYIFYICSLKHTFDIRVFIIYLKNLRKPAEIRYFLTNQFITVNPYVRFLIGLCKLTPEETCENLLISLTLSNCKMSKFIQNILKIRTGPLGSIKSTLKPARTRRSSPCVGYFKALCPTNPLDFMNLCDSINEINT